MGGANSNNVIGQYHDDVYRLLRGRRPYVIMSIDNATWISRSGIIVDHVATILIGVYAHIDAQISLKIFKKKLNKNENKR